MVVEREEAKRLSGKKGTGWEYTINASINYTVASFNSAVSSMEKLRAKLADLRPGRVASVILSGLCLPEIRIVYTITLEPKENDSRNPL
jgi:hypothetical protein